jgi:hypothetical protein
MERRIPKIVLGLLIFTLSIACGLSAVLADDDDDAPSLSIQGSSTVPESTQAPYTAYFNGTRVTASWSLSSTTYATIGSTTGLLTARAVSSNQTVTVRARYSRNGVVYQAYRRVTITNTGTTVSLTSLAVSGPSSVNSGGSASYTATATFSNNTTQNVTANAGWSRSPAVGTISAGTYSPGQVTSNQTVTITASYTSGGVTRSANTTVTVVASTSTVTLSSVAVTGPASVNSGASAAYTATATFSNNTTQNVTASASWNVTPAVGTISGGNYAPGTVTANQNVTISATYTANGVSRSGTRAVTVVAAVATGGKSINSTSQNRATSPSAAVAEQTLTNLSGFSIFSVNDLGMHCGDLDHRVASILPPFNTLHAQVIQKGTSTAPPRILTLTEVDVVYSAASNAKDPALQNPPTVPIFKTNFWDQSPLQPTTSIAFDCYDAYYPPGILSLFPLLDDMGLPSPDNAKLYPLTGAGQLTADQQNMPGITAPYSANVPQSFKRFDTDFPFFATFPFGYRLANMKWFSADGIPIAPFDDFGRANSYPLMRVQAKSKTATLGGSVGATLASVDAVTPVSAEATCTKCHTSSVDGGGGFAADVAFQGSPRSGIKFTVARAADDASDNPPAVKKEWAADTNIIRLHDAKHGTTLQNSTPVSCQVCHYTPALDLAHLGPLGPGDANANGKDQKVHRTNSRVMHAHHGQFTDLFPDDMVAPNNPLRINAATGKPTVNAYVTDKLNQTCYQCHPGEKTQCLRGAMYNGGMICNDCHGGMKQIGNDFSGNFSAATPFPAGADLTKRIPWADEPKCQSCHTGDAMSNLTTSANVIRSSDGIRLLQAWRTNDTNATPIVATNKRFAEETNSGKTVLYRVSKGHGGVSCEACHGSTHAEWPVLPESGNYIANDNMAAIQLQGHAGKISECTACHTAGSLPVSLGGPHGMHPVGDSRFISGHSSLAESNRNNCRTCHGQTGQGTVLSKVSVNRTVGSRTFTKGEQITCSRCHDNQL